MGGDFPRGLRGIDLFVLEVWDGIWGLGGLRRWLPYMSLIIPLI